MAQACHVESPRADDEPESHDLPERDRPDV